MNNDEILAYQKYFELLGSQFAAHPPIEPYVVKISDNNHLVTEGCDDFEVEGGDELYYMHMFGEVRVLMEAVTQGIARGFAEREWEPGMSHPVLYEKKIEDRSDDRIDIGLLKFFWQINPLLKSSKNKTPFLFMFIF